MNIFLTIVFLICLIILIYIVFNKKVIHEPPPPKKEFQAKLNEYETLLSNLKNDKQQKENIIVIKEDKSGNLEQLNPEQNQDDLQKKLNSEFDLKSAIIYNAMIEKKI